jgi:hypothetical protein
MRVDDLRIRAIDGSLLLNDGRFEIVSEDPALPAFIAPASSVVGFRFPRPQESGYLNVYEWTRRESDGFFSCPPPIATVHFPQGAFWPTMPDDWRVWLQPDDPTVSVRRGETSQYASMTNSRLETKRCDAGLAVRIHGQLAVRSEARPVPTAVGHFSAEFVVPWSYLVLQGLASIPGLSNQKGLGPWSAGEPGLCELAVASFGQTFFEGALNLGPNQSPHFGPGPFVKISMFDESLLIMNARRPASLDNGLVTDTSLSDGPQMVLPLLGLRQWNRMLVDVDDATVELKGAGIGHVDGRTGWVYETGGPATQQISELQFRIRRRPDGLLLNGLGKLAPLSCAGESLGPDFSFEFTIPLAYLKMRGIRMPRYLEERRAILAGEDAW